MNESPVSKSPPPSLEAPDSFYPNRFTKRQVAHDINAGLNYAPTIAEARRRYKEHGRKDPIPKIPSALLNSADIASYASLTGMVWPFDPKKLKTASYELSAGGDYTTVDEKGVATAGTLEEGQRLVLKRNSITYVTVRETFHLPDYIALRHNLKINHIYKGLLVGTGPLIDPGFVGKIALPIHNLTSNDYEIGPDEGIVWVEFTKLSPHPDWASRNNVPDYKRGGYPPFPAHGTWNKSVDDYVNDATRHQSLPASALNRIEQTVNNAEVAANRAKLQMQWGLVATVVTAAVAIVPFLWNITVDQRQLISEQSQRIVRLESEVHELQSGYAELAPTPAAIVPTPTGD